MARPSIRNQALVLVQPVTFDALATAGHRQRCPGEGDTGRGLRRRTCRRREDTTTTMKSVLPRRFAFARRPIAPRPSLRLAGAAPTMCRGEGSPLAMKQLIRTTCSMSSGGGVRRHLLLYNSANRL